MNLNTVILEIRPGPGGEEAKLWAADLSRMYSKFALLSGLKTIFLDENVLKIIGTNAFPLFKNEAGVHRVERVQEGLIVRGPLQRGLTDEPEHLHGVVVRLLPEFSVQPLEQPDRLGVPGPPQIVGDLQQGLQRLGEIGDNAEGADSGLAGVQHGGCPL